MGLRYSKRVRLCKGIHLNFSKSGVGISLSNHGTTLSIGPNGTYVTTSFFGTGYSYRTRIDSKPQTSRTKKIKDSSQKDDISNISYHFEIDDEGNEQIRLTDFMGNIVNNETIVRKVKRSAEYKDAIQKAREEKYSFLQKRNDTLVFIYKLTPKIINRDDVIKERDDTRSVQQNFYKEKPFDELQPNESTLYDEAKKIAESTVKTYKFWKKKELIRIATYKKLEELYEKAISEWTTRKNAHIAKEKQLKLEKDTEYKKEYEIKLAERHRIYEQVLNPSKEYLQDTINNILSQIALPVDFSIDYEVMENEICLDIDLPEIEDFPSTTSSILQSGKLSIKKKNVADLNKDYATSVVGLSFFFAGIFFNISPVIEKIAISGYTQRLNKRTGNIENQYVYSVVYARDSFSKLNIENIDPLEAIKNFEHIINISSKFELKTIDVKSIEN